MISSASCTLSLMFAHKFSSRSCLPPSLSLPPVFCFCWTHTETFGLNYIKQTEELRYFKVAHILKYSVSQRVLHTVSNAPNDPR